MRISVPPIAALLLLSACNSPHAVPQNQVAATPTPAPIAPPAPAPTPDQTPNTPPADPLTRHIGKYPFEPVGGVPFFSEPKVVAAVDALVPAGPVRQAIFSGDGPQVPVRERDGKVVAWACENHNCGDHNWLVSLTPDGGDAQICYHDAETTGDHARWYDAKGTSMRPGDCQDDAG